jgi:hypothetical protein
MARCVNSYSVVTITFCQEIDLLRLQARSFTLYLPPDLIDEIIVIANEPPEMPVGWQEQVRYAYGSFRSRVRFLTVRDLTNMPLRSGWFTQQALKLLAAHHVTTSHYLILDSKNHLVFPYTDYHLPPHGRPRMLMHNYSSHHPLRRYLYNALDYFGLPHQVDGFVPTITPFVMPTQLCRDMMQEVAQREQRPFEQTFLRHEPRLTEFFLFGAYLRTKATFGDYYTASGMLCTVIWREVAPHIIQVKAALEHADKAHVPFFAIHRESFVRFDQLTRQLIAEFWARRGLFPRLGAALRFLNK